MTTKSSIKNHTEVSFQMTLWLHLCQEHYIYVYIAHLYIYIYHIHISHHTTYFWCPTTSNFHISHSSPGCRWVSTVDLRWILEWSAKIVDGSRRGVLFFFGKKMMQVFGGSNFKPTVGDGRIHVVWFLWGEKGCDGQKLAKLRWSWTDSPVLCKRWHWVWHFANVLQETATEEESGKSVWNGCEYVFHALGRKLQ